MRNSNRAVRLIEVEVVTVVLSRYTLFPKEFTPGRNLARKKQLLKKIGVGS